MALVGYVYLFKAGITWVWWVVGLAEVFGRLAQLVEQLTLNQRVKGSSPLSPSIISRAYEISYLLYLLWKPHSSHEILDERL